MTQKFGGHKQATIDVYMTPKFGGSQAVNAGGDNKLRGIWVFYIFFFFIYPLINLLHIPQLSMFLTVCYTLLA